jgi:hypothetical protein
MMSAGYVCDPRLSLRGAPEPLALGLNAGVARKTRERILARDGYRCTVSRSAG